jgi:hypothetical protein
MQCTRFLALGVLLVTGSASAEVEPSTLIEARAGPYYPEVDSEFARRSAPFRATFGRESRLLLGFEYDRDVLAGTLGTIAIGVGFGYTRFSAHSLLGDGSRRRSKEESSLTLVPVSLLAVGRLGVLMNEYEVPLVPYGKAGVGGAFWWTRDGKGTAEEHDVIGRGSSWGPQVALGGMLLLDALDRRAAAHMHTSTGIRHSYFFVEWYGSWLGMFGRNQMRVGARSWAAGLAFQI